jgi:hypothetical protein
MDHVEFHLSERTIRVLINLFRSGRLRVAKHQRQAKAWNLQYKQKFVDSLKRGHPCPLVLIYEDGDGQFWIEDGLQRISSLSAFMGDEFPELENGSKYADWTPHARDLFELYKLPVLLYSNADQMTRVMIFDRFQNGSPLRVGERLNALGHTDLVSMTRKLLLADKNDDGITVVGEYYARLCAVLGPLKIGEDDKRYSQLCEMTAVMNGLAHGFLDNPGISKKYEDLRGQILRPIDEASVRTVLDKVLTIFEEARRERPLDDKRMLTMLRNPGNFLGPIVYSLKMYPTEWDRLSAGWTDVLVRFARDPEVLKNKDTGLLKDLSGARSWNNTRWRMIYENAFNIAHSGLDPVDSNDHSDEDTD